MEYHRQKINRRAGLPSIWSPRRTKHFPPLCTCSYPQDSQACCWAAESFETPSYKGCSIQVDVIPIFRHTFSSTRIAGLTWWIATPFEVPTYNFSSCSMQNRALHIFDHTYSSTRNCRPELVNRNAFWSTIFNFSSCSMQNRAIHNSKHTFSSIRNCRPNLVNRNTFWSANL